MGNVPVFKTGEPGFTAKLNELGDVIRQLVEDFKALEGRLEKAEAVKAEAPAEKAKAPARPARKTAATS